MSTTEPSPSSGGQEAPDVLAQAAAIVDAEASKIHGEAEQQFIAATGQAPAPAEATKPAEVVPETHVSNLDAAEARAKELREHPQPLAPAKPEPVAEPDRPMPATPTELAGTDTAIDPNANLDKFFGPDFSKTPPGGTPVIKAEQAGAIVGKLYDQDAPENQAPAVAVVAPTEVQPQIPAAAPSFESVPQAPVEPTIEDSVARARANVASAAAEMAQKFDQNLPPAEPVTVPVDAETTAPKPDKKVPTLAVSMDKAKSKVAGHMADLEQKLNQELGSVSETPPVDNTPLTLEFQEGVELDFSHAKNQRELDRLIGIWEGKGYVKTTEDDSGVHYVGLNARGDAIADQIYQAEMRIFSQAGLDQVQHSEQGKIRHQVTKAKERAGLGRHPDTEHNFAAQVEEHAERDGVNLEAAAVTATQNEKIDNDRAEASKSVVAPKLAELDRLVENIDPATGHRSEAPVSGVVALEGGEATSDTMREFRQELGRQGKAFYQYEMSDGANLWQYRIFDTSKPNTVMVEIHDAQDNAVGLYALKTKEAPSRKGLFRRLRRSRQKEVPTWEAMRLISELHPPTRR